MSASNNQGILPSDIRLVNTILYGLLSIDCINNNCRILNSAIPIWIPIINVNFTLSILAVLICAKFITFNAGIIVIWRFLNGSQARISHIAPVFADEDPALVQTRARLQVDMNNLWVKERLIAAWSIAMEIILYITVWFLPYSVIGTPFMLAGVLLSSYQENISN